jgi:PKD repeat protein
MHHAPYRVFLLAVGMLFASFVSACKRDQENATTTSAATKAETPSFLPKRSPGLIDAMHIRVTPAVPTVEPEADEPKPSSVSVTANADPDSGGAPLVVNFEAEVSEARPGLRYRWDFGDKSPPAYQLIVQHTYQSPGEYTATFTATGPDVDESDEVSIDVTEEGFDVDIEADPDIGGAPLTVHFSAVLDDDLVGPFYYQWDFGDGSHDVSNPTNHTYRAAGQYTATLAVTNAQGQVGRKDIEIQVDAREGQADGQ